ncbi:MAG: PIN domain-containing protein [Acidimicrobiia bacterium]
MRAVVLDTDVASAILRRQAPDTLESPLADTVPAVSFITAGELHRWAYIRNWGSPRRRKLDDWLASVLVLESTPATWRIWGRITAEARGRGHPRPVADSWIAACCLAWGLPLLTFNRHDFEDFASHNGLELRPS